MNQQTVPGIEKRSSKEDFNKYFLSTENLAKLAESCAYGEVPNLRCRWAAWKAFLGLIPVGDEAKIRTEVQKQRSFYAGEYDKFMNFRSKVKLSAEVDNPLSTNTNNPWNSFYTDSELKDEIKKDIERTYQDMDFFLVKSTQTVLTNILFIWSKQNPDVSYRQGMNEIVAVLTYACFTENFTAQNPDENLYDFLNDEKYSEADIYTVFKKVMELDQKQMFAVTQPSKKKKKQTSDGPVRPDLPIVHRSVYVQEELLPRLNGQIFSHFQSLGVEPHIYMMRWLRCMLVREFKITQALELWDAVYAYHYKFTPTSKKLEMFDYLCVAMILNISRELLDIDNGGMLLGKLLKYPPTDDVTSLVQNCHHGVLDVLSSESGKSTKPVQFAQSRNPFGASQNEPKSGGFGTSEKKVVLFNPATTTTKQNDSNAMYQPVIASKPFTQADPQLKHAKSSTSSEPHKEEDNQIKAKIPSDKYEGSTVVENKPQERGSRMILFGQPTTSKPEPKESHMLFNGGAQKPVTTLPKETRIGDSLPTDTERETSDCIKKLQNAMKLVKIENDDNHSLNLEEAITDLNSVIRTLKDRISKK